MFKTDTRVDNLRKKIIEKKLGAFLVSKAENRFYLTGWLGDRESGYLLITPRQNFVITDSRYTEEVVKSVAGFELREYGQDEEFWKKLFRELALNKVGVEGLDFSLAELKRFRKATRGKFVPQSNLIEELRTVKDSEEIKLIKKAISIADKSFEFVLKNIKLGLREREIAWEIEKFMRDLGASKNAWDNLIVASGPNSSMAHYPAGDRKIKKGDTILLDWGCFYKGYCCDISRVVFLGTPTLKQIEVYNLVLKAQKKAVERVRAGVKTKVLDKAARDFLKTKSKYYFTHAVGHGVGIEVHELPRINEKAKEKLGVGNIITIEPGIYEPGWGGVRIEDMYLIEENSAIELTKSPKKITEIIVS